MTRKQAVRRRAVAGALTMSLLSAGVVMVTDAVLTQTPDPAIRVEGLELKMKTDPDGKQSVQALVEISLTNVFPIVTTEQDQLRRKVEKTIDFCRGAVMTLDYNPNYLEPSDWVTNVGYGESGIRADGRVFRDDKAQTTPVTDPIDYSDPLHHLFFRTDEDLYSGTYSDNSTPVDPLAFWTENNADAPSATNVPAVRDSGILTVDGNKNRIHFDLQIRDDTEAPMSGAGGRVKKTASSNKTDFYYFEFEKTNDTPKENKLTLGTLSFRVNDKFVAESGTVEDLEKKLQDMVEKFDGLNWEYDKDKQHDPSAGAGDYLFRESKAGVNEDPIVRDMKYLIERVTYARGPSPNVEIGRIYDSETEGYAIGIQISIEADDVIQDVWPVKDDITINSYQAFTNGDIADLAIAMQNYAESVRVKRVSGKMNDMSIYWGDPVNNPASASMPADGPGMFIRRAVPGMVDDGAGGQVPGWVEDTTSPRYRFRWNGSGYIAEQEVTVPPITPGDPPTTHFTPVASDDVYGIGKLFDPRGNYLGDDQYGHYIIKQYFTYWENTGSGGSGAMALKTFPKPVEVALHVTPIKVIDASVEKRQLTYRNSMDDVPQLFPKLDLADDAKLTLDTTINGLTPAMPVSWTPADSPAWVAGTLNSTVLGVAGDGNPNYTLAAPGNVAEWPIGEAAITAGKGIGTYTFETKVLQADVQKKYPWVTVDKDYDLDSIRRIVDVSPLNPGDPERHPPRYVMWAEPYEVAPAGAAAGVTAGDPVARLQITIARQDATWNAATEEWDWAYTDMNAGYQFKLYMPNDQQIMADATESWFGPQSGTTWSGLSGSSYTLYHRNNYTDADKGLTNLKVYQFSISPGDLNVSDTYAAQREVLRQYINLGGWYSADILEPGADPQTGWNDRVSGFSKPRTNIHVMSYILNPAATPTPVPTGTETWMFDYTGNRAGLMPFYSDSDLPTFLTLPADETVEVRYDAVTGSQPGQLRQFKVEGFVPASPSPAPERWSNVMGNKWTSGDPVPDAPAWATPVPAASPSPAVPGEVVTYGEELFARSYDYSNFGTVNNPETPGATGYPTELQDRKAKVRVEVQDPIQTTPQTPKWELKLTYEQSGDNVTEYPDGQVKRVTFDNKMEGFTYQQIVTLTLTNTGTMDIRGLHIEIPDTPNGPCFRLVTPPPASLAVGASATFQLSYIQNLAEGTYEDIFTTEPIHIWHDNSGPADDGLAPDRLPGHDEGFEAVLKVTKTRPHRVTVVIHPSVDDTGAVTKPMGDGWLVEGVTTQAGADKYSGTLGGNVYEQNERFWVLTQPEDEYSLITMKDGGGTPRVWVYYVRDDDPNQTKVYLNEYSSGGGNTGFGTVDKSFVTQDNPERLFWGEMPDGSVTVHVHYYEPLLSKLRLSDLHAYAWDEWSEVKLKSPAEAAAWEEKAGISSDPADANSYLTEPDAFERPLNVHNGGNDYEQILFRPERDEYIVFLDPSSKKTDNLCGVSIALRKLVTHINGIGDTANPVEQNNVDIYPNVMMTLDDADNTIVCNDVPDPGVVPPSVPSTPSTAGPTYHHSTPFSAPVDDPTQTSIAQTTVTITISYDGTALVPPEGLETRTYKVRFVREMEPGKAKHIALAGNSPYGMIENDSTITDKAAARQVFDAKNRFDFTAANAAYLPKQATALKNIYWPEAWGDGVNYDKDITALFVYAGEEFYDPGVKNIYNNAGDYIDGIEVTRSLEYVKLDTTQTTPWDRFNVDPAVTTNLATIDLGTVPAVNGVIPGDTMTLTADDGKTSSYDGMIAGLVGVDDIRPGIYELKYTYKDHDKTTDLYFTRPLIVLSPNGDVDANWVQQGAGADRLEIADKVAIQRRFSAGTALPYELPITVYSAADTLVYKYRIVDANNDRNINNIDAGLIRKMTELVHTPAKLTEFYRPTEYTYPVKP